jgi:hypothetical protein
MIATELFGARQMTGALVLLVCVIAVVALVLTTRDHRR